MATVLGVILIVAGAAIAATGRLTARTYGRDSAGRRIGIWLLFFATGVGVASAGFALI
ncbi:hypothetical protein ACIO1C_28990 [Streptomyces sp. NPDC087420]|uniref:hypothetical protein n=1 Tax=Streptomyces sp. NPDC087420 TaxID=3365785 RepID=UPI0038336ADD